MTDNSYSIVAYIKDVAGNLSTVSPTLTVTIDTDAPDQLSVPAIYSLDDSGWSNADDTTSFSQPRFEISGTAEGDSVFLLFNSTTVGRTLSAGGVITMTPATEQTHGTYSVQVSARDGAGNSSVNSNALALRIDTQASAAPDAPDLFSIYDTGESNSDNITSATILSFTLTGLASSDSVLLKLNSNTVGRTLTTGNYITN